MIFLSPMALYLFGLAGVIIAFYFLKQKVDTLPVSALFLWQKFAQKPKSAWRFFWSGLFGLLLQLLALAFLVSALANPVFYTKAQGPKRIAVIVDGSLSMQARTEGKRTRYDEAVARAIEIIGASPAAQITVIQAASKSAILSPLSHTGSEVINALRRSRPTFQANAALKDLLELLKSQAPLESFDRIVYLADHMPQDELLKDLGIELVLVGTPSETAAVPPRNVGITTFAVRRQPRGLASLQVDKLTSLEHSVLVTLENFSAERVSTHLRVLADDEIISETDLVMEAETRVNHEFSYSGPTRFLKAEIALEDDLEADNVRYFAPPNVAEARILWLGDENPFLKSALSVLGEFTFEAVTSANSQAAYDLIVANNTHLTKAIGGNLFLINSELPDVIEFVDDKEALTGWSLKAVDHHLLEGLELNEFFSAPFQKAKVSERGQIIVAAKTDSGEHPLFYLYEDGKTRLVWLGLDLRYANPVLSIDFPILIKNIVSWLLPWLYGETNTIGDVIPVLGLSKAQIINPLGQIAELSDQMVFLDTNLPGFYRLMAQDRVLIYAVNPPASESDIRPGPPPQAKTLEPKSMSEAKLANQLRPMLILGGLILLLLELYFYEAAALPMRLKGVKK